MTEFVLNTAQKGYAAAEAFLIKEKQDGQEAKRMSTGTEHDRLDEALSALKREFSEAALKETGEDADIFRTEGMLLEDNKFTDVIRARMREEKICLTQAVREAGEVLAKEMESGSSEYNRQRSEDIRGIAERLVDILDGKTAKQMTGPSILVAEELSPAVLISMDKTLIRGIVTVKGSAASHLSILSGSLGIPYLYGSEEAVGAVKDGDRLIIDGGRLLVGPDELTYQEAFKKALKLSEENKRVKVSGDFVKCRTKVCANIAGTDEINDLKAAGADGVGLFRTEFLFLNNAEPPSEEEQFQAYRIVAEALGEKELVIRTMDLGSDKTPEWMSLSGEKNPMLGLRGIRISLQEKDLFRTQLRSVMRAASFGKVKIMLPMITSVWEVEEVRRLIEIYANELREEGIPYSIPSLGIMIETPAAVMVADELAKTADFFSIGTNDLAQYALAADREGTGLDRYYDMQHEAVFRLIEQTVEAAHKRNIPVAVCGELAGSVQAVKRLIKAGVDELSVAVFKVGSVRETVFRAETELEEEIKQDILPASIAAPADGMLIRMEDIPDPAFSSGSLGACLGIMPENGNIYAPCSGVVSAVAETKHAVTLTASDGRVILIHVGIDTVKMNGEGMNVLVSEGESVSEGQKIMEADIVKIKSAGFSPIIIAADVSCTQISNS